MPAADLVMVAFLGNYDQMDSWTYQVRLRREIVLEGCGGGEGAVIRLGETMGVEGHDEMFCCGLGAAPRDILANYG